MDRVGSQRAGGSRQQVCGGALTGTSAVNGANNQDRNSRDIAPQAAGLPKRARAQLMGTPLLLAVKPRELCIARINGRRPKASWTPPRTSALGQLCQAAAHAAQHALRCIQSACHTAEAN